MDEFRRAEASEHYERAMILERSGRIAEALAEYRRAVDVDPGFSAAHEALGYHYQRRGLLMKACDAFQTVARLEGHYNAYFNLGFILVEVERYEEALTAFQQCLALVPDDPAALYEIAYVQYILGQLAEAKATLRIPQEAYPNDWRVYNLLGACHLGLENWPEAEAEYLLALSFATVPEEVDEARAGLQSAQRYQEFPAGTPLGFKERAYADAGLVVLGTAGDDGLTFQLREHLAVTPPVVAVTLRRFQSVVEALDFGLTAVIAVDRESIPLAAAIASLLALPRKRLLHLAATERPLLVLLAGRQPELLQVALEQAPPGAISFIYAMSGYGESDLLPDLVGVPVQQALPPEKTRSNERQVRTITRALLDACAATPDEANQEAQVRFYIEHRKLRFREQVALQLPSNHVE